MMIGAQRKNSLETKRSKLITWKAYEIMILNQFQYYLKMAKNWTFGLIADDLNCDEEGPKFISFHDT